MSHIIPLPMPVRHIYEAVEQLEAKYRGRKFAPDGHMVGSIGEVIAAEVLGLTLLAASTPFHDAKDDQGRLVQIKATAGNGISLYGTCERLVVLRIVKPDSAEIVYDGPGDPVWKAAAKPGKNGQSRVGLAALRRLARQHPSDAPARGGIYAALRSSPLAGAELQLDRVATPGRNPGL